MVKFEMLTSQEDLMQHLHSVIHQIHRFDFPMLCSARRESEFEASLHRFHLMSRVEHLREAAKVQGKAWQRMLISSYGVDGHLLEAPFTRAGYPPYYLHVLGLASQWLGLDDRSTMELHLFSCLRDQVSAAIRLGVIGPSVAHRILVQSFGAIDLPDPATLNHELATRTMPMLDIAQMAHLQVYSKQFKN